MKQKYYRYKSFSGLERAVYTAQEEEIEKRHGKQAAQEANYGWGVDASDTGVSVATKVYVAQAEILCTNAELGNNMQEFSHNWSDYD